MMLFAAIVTVILTFFGSGDHVSQITLQGTEEAVYRMELALDTMTLREQQLVLQYTDRINLSQYPLEPGVGGAHLWTKTSSFYPEREWVHHYGERAIHEAVHHRDYQQCVVVGGVESEKRAIWEALNYLTRVRRPGNSQDYFLVLYNALAWGKHGQNFPYRYVSPHCTFVFDPDTQKSYYVDREEVSGPGYGWKLVSLADYFNGE